MGETVFTRSLYSAAKSTYDVGEREVTKRAEQKAHSTGKLEPLVDPAGFGVIRLSLPRVEEQEDKRWKMLVGTPLPVETRCDTTSSMGDNVDVAMRVLPDVYEAISQVLEGYDPHICTGIFGDVCDRFVLCRPQFEMQADKIVNQLTMMAPQRGGGDVPEDPDLGIFGGAYFCRHYINRIGLKGYDFTVTDAPGRGRIADDQLERVYGDKIWEKLEENEHRVAKQGSYQLEDVFADLLDRAHAFVLQVGNSASTRHFWEAACGKERVVQLPSTENLPHVQAAIIGLTEGTLLMADVAEFLQGFNMSKSKVDAICESLVDIPIGAQSRLPNYEKRPQKGDLFDGKPDVWKDEHLWPVERAADREEEPAAVTDAEEKDEWL